MRSWFRRRAVVELPPGPAYALWAETYRPEPHNPLMLLEARAMRDLLPPLAGRHVLDVACGTGRYLAELEAGGAARAVGADASHEMAARARATGYLVVQADAASMPFPAAAFDLVICALAVGHMARLGPAIAEMARLLRPDGLLVCSDMHPAGAEAGWRRTFRAADGRTYAVAHHVHRLEDHQRACADAGLVIEDTREPALDDADDEWRGRPAVLAFRARRGR
jgi:malonyl-CoA O-methyltransferase